MELHNFMVKNIFKKTLKNLSILSAGLAIGSGLTFLGIKYYKKPKEEIKSKEKTELIVSNLTLNSNDLVSLVTDKDENSGIEDIRRIKSPYEESWLYLPDKKRWYEIGTKRAIEIGEDESWHRTKITYDPKLITNALKENLEARKLVFYHNHPLSEKVQREIESLKENDKITIASEENPFNEYPLTTGILRKTFSKYPSLDPSTTDLNSMILQTLKFGPLGYDVKHKICSEEGVTEYFLTQDGIDHYKNKKVYGDFLDQECLSITCVSKDSISLENDYIKINSRPFKGLEDKF